MQNNCIYSQRGNPKYLTFIALTKTAKTLFKTHLEWLEGEETLSDFLFLAEPSLQEHSGHRTVLQISISHLLDGFVLCTQFSTVKTKINEQLDTF